MKRYYIFDYIWYIGEALKREGSPSSGATLLLLTWLFAFLMPLIMPFMYQLLGIPVVIFLGLAMIFLPILLCKLRYTRQRREAIFKHYSGIKNIFTRWLVLFGAIIVIAAINFMLMYHMGFITKKL